METIDSFRVISMYKLFELIAEVFIPIVCVVFCLNLVSIIKKAQNKETTTINTFWLTLSFVIIVWSISIFAPLY